jgi:hypothetical protein
MFLFLILSGCANWQIKQVQQSLNAQGTIGNTENFSTRSGILTQNNGVTIGSGITVTYGPKNISPTN